MKALLILLSFLVCLVGCENSTIIEDTSDNISYDISSELERLISRYQQTALRCYDLGYAVGKNGRDYLENRIKLEQILTEGK